MTSSNAYTVSEQADSELIADKLPQFSLTGQKLLDELSEVVTHLKNTQLNNTQASTTSENTPPVESPDSAPGLDKATALIEQLNATFAQLPEIVQRLSRDRALIQAQREASMDGILVVDESDRILSINQKFCDFWKVPPELSQVQDDHKMLGHAVNQTADPEQFLAKVRYLYDHPHESSQDELLLKDGRIGARYSAPVISADGEYFGRVWYFRDITQQKRQEQTLKQMNEALEAEVRARTKELSKGMETLQSAQTQLIQSEKMVALGNLVSGVAHEVNNPVGFIAGNVRPALDYIQDLFGLLDLYDQHVPNPPEAIASEVEEIDLDYIKQDLPKLIGSIESGAKRIKDISTSLRTFSRADTGSPVAFNIHDGLDSTLLILKHRLKASDERPEIKVVKHYASLPSIECYAGQLNQVFMNLLANAIDAVDEATKNKSITTEGCIEVETCLLERETGEQVQVTIKDNGIGMSQAVKEKVFEHLFTTKAVGKGTGLGLAIARQIICDVHQGAINAESEPGMGTTFVITLPTKAPEQTDADAAELFELALPQA